MRRDGHHRLGEALQRLPTLSRAELRSEWQRLYRTEPPGRISRELLISAIAYRLQEAALGGLRPELQRRLRNVAERVRRGEEPERTGTPRLKPGTRLLREWQGRTHEILVGEDGFVWQQTNYRSLSEVARAITGTRWSGPVFFGLRRRSLRRSDGSADAAR
jgi:DUF2924 family protein